MNYNVEDSHIGILKNNVFDYKVYNKFLDYRLILINDTQHAQNLCSNLKMTFV